MPMKWIGALLIIGACGGLGAKVAADHRYEERTMRQLVALLDFMECELHFRLTPLPELCRQTAAEGSGVLSAVFLNLAIELEDQIHPDVYRCMLAAVSRITNLPVTVEEELKQMARSLGRFDLTGQLKGLEASRQSCRRKLDKLCDRKDERRRGYQTLALCAGAGLAILFI